MDPCVSGTPWNAIGRSEKPEIFVDRQIRVEAELLRYIPKKGPDINAILPNIPPKESNGAKTGRTTDA